MIRELRNIRLDAAKLREFCTLLIMLINPSEMLNEYLSHIEADRVGANCGANCRN